MSFPGLPWVMVLVLVAPIELLRADEAVRNQALGFRFPAPEGDWQRLEPTDHQGGGRRFEVRQGEDETDLVIDATYFQTSRFLGRLAVRLPAVEQEQLDLLVTRTIAAITIDPHATTDPPPPAGPIGFGAGDPEQVLTVVHGDDREELAFTYLEALSGAARTNRGLPVVLAVRGELGPAARAFLAKYRPGTIRMIGPTHPRLPQATPAREDWPTGGTVVVCERSLDSAVLAGNLAVRLEAPLLVDRGRLGPRLETLMPERVFVLGDVSLPKHPGYPVERLAGPVAVARAAGGADYVALTNVAPGPASGVSALAAALAGVREGIVLPFDQQVVRHQIPLRRTESCPPGLETAPARMDGGSSLVAQIATDAGPVLAGAVQTGVIRVATDRSPRFGRLRIDLDGDGLLESDEEPRIGTCIELDGQRYHLTYHYRHAFVGYLREELILGSVDPQVIRGQIRSLVEALDGADHLAIVGTPAQIPFCYEEASGGFEAYDIKQELPSDAPYANLDQDSYLELAVGRLPVSSLTEGSAMIATTIAYPRLDGDWTGRATMIQPGFFELEGELPWVLPNAEAMIRGIEGDLASAGVSARGFYRDDVQIDAVLDAMSNSAWIAYFNHSGPGTWGIHPGASIVTGKARGRRDRSLPALDGAPIVFGGGCSSAALDVGQPVESTFPGRFFQLGAVAYLGNTRVAFARSEHLVQLFFARLASGDSTLGEAYRDGRNFLAHLLEHGHIVEPLEQGVELGVRDFLWGQHRILNLFGDPALRPRRPAASAQAVPPIQIDLEPTGRQDRLQLTISYRGGDRRDPVMMMPASGQGRPREFFARTGPGLSASHLPYNFVAKDLEPVRSHAEIQPGAWVDVELPAGAREVEVTRVAGPEFTDRGFAVLPGGRGEPRLLMFVPLVRASPELGDGELVRRVEFEVAFARSDAGRAERQSVSRIRPEPAWSRQPATQTRISPQADELLERIRQRYTPRRVPASLTWTMPNPQPRLYGEKAFFRGSWSDAGQAVVEARALTGHLAPRRQLVEKAIRTAASLPFSVPLPALLGMNVAVDGSGRLLLTPLGSSEGERSIRIHVSTDGTIQSLLNRRFGIAEETLFEWHETGAGPVLARRTRRDPVRPQAEEIYEITYRSKGIPAIPERITLRLPGMLPDDVPFEFRYPRDV